METLLSDSPLARYLADMLGEIPFTLLDIGCSGGIDGAWRLFDRNLRALAFDPNLEECKRLEQAETLKNVTYLPAFVRGAKYPSENSPDSFWTFNPWDRLSVAATLRFKAAATSRMTTAEKTSLNLWQKTELADPGDQVYLPDFLRDRGIDDVDFIKIDVDGPDFEILKSLDQVYPEAKVLGVGVEVNYYGSDSSTDHTFHNVDRYLRSKGFDLFALTTRKYSSAALPFPYAISIPAQTLGGRPLQGDALYLRDLSAPHNGELAQAWGPHKLGKLAAILSLFALPDFAAEILITRRNMLSEIMDIDRGLKLLLDQLQQISGKRIANSVAEYKAAFESDSRSFYP